MAQSSKSRTLDFNPKQLFNIKSNQFPSKNSTKSTSRFLPKLDSFTPSSSLLFFRSTKFNAPKKLEEIRNQNMGSMAIYPLLPSKPRSSVLEQNSFVFPSRRKSKKMKLSFSPVARLFGPSIFEASKLKVLFVGVDEEKHPGKLPRTYTLTHSDITAKLTLAVSQTINNSQLQGWGNKIYRDEVVAEWKKVKGKMSLHVHCHISGGHFLLDLCARLRYFIFCKELPVVLKAFVHGDGNLFNNYPELEEALVWVYFHSNIPEFNRAECWGPLRDPVRPSTESDKLETPTSNRELPEPCKDNCECCFPPISVIHWSNKSESRQDDTQQGFHQATE